MRKTNDDETVLVVELDAEDDDLVGKTERQGTERTAVSVTLGWVMTAVLLLILVTGPGGESDGLENCIRVWPEIIVE